MIQISGEVINRKLDFPTLVASLCADHRTGMDCQQDMLLRQPNPTDDENYLLVRAAWKRNDVLGIKMATIFPDNKNRQQPLPAVQAIYALFDAENGTPRAIIDGDTLTYWKTAADSALGSSILARKDCKKLLMIGAGAMAPWLIKAHLAVRPGIEHITIWNRNPARADQLAISLDLPGKHIHATSNLDNAVGICDLICSATMSQNPIIKGALLSPGCHVDLVGAFTPTMREADDECMQRSRLFVDSRLTTIDEIGELMIPLAKGIISENDIQADLYDLCQGARKGRQNDQEITLFKNGGGGHLDLMCARLLHSHRKSA